jgi:phospholipid-binding lipoprotein MlaA
LSLLFLASSLMMVADPALLAGAQNDAVSAGEPLAPAPVPIASPTVANPPAASSPAASSPAASSPVGTATPAAPPAPGDITVSGRKRQPKVDPLESVNVRSFAVVQKVDDNYIAPVANAYGRTVPSPIRAGIRHFLRNVTEPVTALHHLLQLHPGKAGKTLGRFAINSTIGVGGLGDVAKNKPFRLPYYRNGLANTLGYYGVGPGPYVYLPIIGPTTLRDLFGLTVDRLMVPAIVGTPFNTFYYGIPTNILKSLDERVETQVELQRMKDANDPYLTYRKTYLRARYAEIEALHGRYPVVEAPPVQAVPPPAAPPPAPLPPVFISEPVIQPLPAAR